MDIAGTWFSYITQVLLKVLDNAFTQHKNCSPLHANRHNQSVNRIETRKKY